MKWKPALIAACVVVLAGFGVGVAIGGESETRTVVRTETVAIQSAPTEASEDSESMSTPEAAGPTPAEPQYLSDTEDPPVDNLYTEDTVTTARLGREKVDHAVDLYLLDDPNLKGTIKYPIEDEGYSKLRFKAGWAPTATAGANIRLEIRADSPTGDKLLPKPLDFKDSTPQDVEVDLRGATTVVFVFSDPTCADTYEDKCLANGEEFILGEARFEAE